MRRFKIKKRRTGLGLTALVVLLICGMVSYGRIGLEAKSRRTIERLAECKQEKEALEKETIENEKPVVLTDRDIIQWARDKFGLVFEDEIIFEAEE